MYSKLGTFPSSHHYILGIYLFIAFFFLRAALVAYGSSQARGQIGAAATGLIFSWILVRYLTH